MACDPFLQNAAETQTIHISETTEDPVRRLVDLSYKVDALNKWSFQTLVRGRNFQPLMEIADTLSAINGNKLLSGQEKDIFENWSHS